MLELNAQIRLNSKPFFTCGDTVRGKLLVFTSKPISVRNIEVKMRCDENAYNDIDSQVIGGSSHIHEKTRHLSVDHVVFPDKSTLKHASDDTQLTLSKGTHQFDFEFYLPDKIGDYQSFLASDCRSGIKWYIKGVVHRANTLERATRVVHDFPVYPIVLSPYDPLQLKEVREEDTFNMYLPGYSDKVRSTSGRFKELVSFNSSLRKHVNANFSLKIPYDGIPHAPASIPVQVDISSSDENLLQVKRFELQLKEKCVVYTKKGNFRQVFRTLHELFDIEVNLPLDLAVQKIQETIDDTIFERNLPATFKNEHFNLTYKMVGVVHVASIGNSSTSKKIRLSTPVTLRYLDRSPRELTPITPEVDYQEPELPVYEKFLPAGEMNLVG